jgi:hypothetical protein
MEVTLCTHLALHIEERLSKTILPWGPTVSRHPNCTLAAVAANPAHNWHTVRCRTMGKVDNFRIAPISPTTWSFTSPNAASGPSSLTSASSHP